jgi:hypothetical protein
MSQMIRSAAVLLGLIALASRAEAQAAAQPKPSPLKAAATEYSFEIRPTLGLVIPLAPSGDVGWDIGGSLRVRPPSWPVGLQLDLFQFTADAFFPFATGSKSFEPYIIAGLGMYDGEFGINAGVGADFAISGSPIGFFAETRFHVVFEPGDNPNLLPINAGVRLRF